MKKLVLALFVAAVLVGAAFAAGHIIPTPFTPVEVTPEDVPVEGDVTVVGVRAAAESDITSRSSGIIALGTKEGADYAIHTAFFLNLNPPYPDPLVINLTKVLEQLPDGTSPNVVLIPNKAGTVVEFPIVGGKISVPAPTEYFTENILMISTKVVPSSSSSGCTTGSFAPAFVLLLAPLALLLKK